MKYIGTVLVMSAAMLFVVGCGDKPTEETKQEKVVKKPDTKEPSVSPIDTVKEVTKQVKEKTEAVAKEVTQKAEEVVKKANEVVKEVNKTVTKVVDTITEEVTTPSKKVSEKGEGVTLYAVCAACHGVDGKTRAMGKSEPIAGQDVKQLVESLKQYREGTRNISGMGSVMKPQVAKLTDGQIEAVSAYISTMKQ